MKKGRNPSWLARYGGFRGSRFNGSTLRGRDDNKTRMDDLFSFGL